MQHDKEIDLPRTDAEEAQDSDPRITFTVDWGWEESSAGASEFQYDTSGYVIDAIADVTLHDFPQNGSLVERKATLEEATAWAAQHGFNLTRYIEGLEP